MDIFVDIDGTLTVETDGHGYRLYSNRTPRKDIIKKINRLYYDGNHITIWTARYKEDEKVTKDWLRYNGVKFHSLIFDKPKFDLYICDRVLNVEDL